MNLQHENHGPLPTREDINVFDSLDERCACDHFLGKNMDEAQALFSDNFLRYQEDLVFMGPRAFRFYVHAAMQYLMSPDASGDGDAANSFAGLLEFRLEHERNEVQPVAGELARICNYLFENISRFECEPSIYGDVGARYAALNSALEQLATTQP